MGTFFEIEVLVSASDSQSALDWIENTRDEIQRLESIYSRHDETSELSRVNRRRLRSASDSSISPRPVSMSDELTSLLHAADQLHHATNGAFDVSIDPMRIDLDGISKGAVLDRLRESFESRFPGAPALFNFGQSSIAAIGNPDGRGWRLVLQSRDPARGLLGVVTLLDQSLSMSSSLSADVTTSEPYESHIIDPRSRKPVTGYIEAVVVSESATRADAWSTALLVTRRVPDLDRVENRAHGGFEAMLINDEGAVSRTDNWPGSILSGPTKK